MLRKAEAFRSSAIFGLYLGNPIAYSPYACNDENEWSIQNSRWIFIILYLRGTLILSGAQFRRSGLMTSLAEYGLIARTLSVLLITHVLQTIQRSGTYFHYF